MDQATLNAFRTIAALKPVKVTDYTWAEVQEPGWFDRTDDYNQSIAYARRIVARSEANDKEYGADWDIPGSFRR